MVDVRLPDGRIVRNVPEGTTKAQLMAKIGDPKLEAKSRLVGASPYSAADLATYKMTAHLSDKLVPLAQAGIQSLTSGGNFGQNYQRAQSERDRLRTRYQQDNPIGDWASLPLNMFLGGPSKIASAVSSIPSMIKSGLAYGGLYGAADARGTAKQQAAQTATGAAIGGVTAPILGKLISSAVPAIVNAGRNIGQGQKGRSARIVGEVLNRQEGGARGAMRTIRRAQQRGVPLALADTGDATRGALNATARMPGPGRTIARDFVVPRQEGAAGIPSQAERIQAALQRDLGPTTNVTAQSEQMMNAAKVASGPLYEQAYAAPAISTPKLQELLDTPFGRQALAGAKTIAANERIDPAGLGFALDDAGNVILNPVPVAHIDRIDAARSAYDAANTAYETLARKQQSSLTPNLFSSGLAKAESNLATANAELDAAKRAFSQAPKSGSVQETRGYTTKTLDYVKRGMDDIIESMRDPVTGRLRLNEAGRAQNNVLRNLIQEVDRLNPQYGVARAVYAGPAKLTSAMQKGKSAVTMDAEKLQAMTKNMTPAELDQFRLGFRSGLSGQIEARVDGADKVRALVGSGKKRAALAQVFGGEKGLDNFINTLIDEQRAAQTYAMTNTGSRTADNLADMVDMSGLGGVALNAGGRAASGQGLIPNAIATGRDLMRYGLGKSGEEVRAQVAAGLTETNPDVLRQMILDAYRQNIISKNITNRAKQFLPQSGMASGRFSGGVTNLLFGEQERPY